MQISAEIRWFWRDPGPVHVKEWFRNAQVHGFDAGGPRVRVDRYLRDHRQAELGIKSRDEHPGEELSVEMKGLVNSALGTLNAGPFVGTIELCSRALGISFCERTSLATQKERWLRKFDTSAQSPGEIPLGKDEQPQLVADGRKRPLHEGGASESG
jgi:hypothetical protein